MPTTTAADQTDEAKTDKKRGKPIVLSDSDEDAPQKRAKTSDGEQSDTSNEAYVEDTDDESQETLSDEPMSDTSSDQDYEPRNDSAMHDEVRRSARLQAQATQSNSDDHEVEDANHATAYAISLVDLQIRALQVSPGDAGAILTMAPVELVALINGRNLDDEDDDDEDDEYEDYEYECDD